MKILISILTLALGLWGNTLCSQDFTDPNQVLKQKRHIIGGLDNRRTFLKGNQTVIYGLYCGIGFGKNLRLKLGINGNPFPIKFQLHPLPLHKHNRMAFISLGEEYSFFRYKKLTFITYLQAGLGYNFYSILDDREEIIHTGREWVAPLEIGLHTAYALNPWLSAKVGSGWRFVFPDREHDLSGYYLKLGLGIDTEYVWKWYQQKRENCKKQTFSK